MEKITWIEPYYDIILNLIPKDVKTVLDVGSGSGIFGFIIKKTRDCHITAVEPFEYNLSHYDDVIQSTWQKAQIKKTFDCVVSTEMIEHMEKSNALEFLDNVKKISHKVIVATPYKFEQQAEYDDNPYQIHASQINVEDFEKRGYKIFLLGVFSIRGLTARILFRKVFKPALNVLGVKVTNIIAVWSNK